MREDVKDLLEKERPLVLLVELREWLERSRASYEKGVMCSIAESCWCSTAYGDVIAKLDKLQKEYGL